MPSMVGIVSAELVAEIERFLTMQEFVDVEDSVIEHKLFNA